MCGNPMCGNPMCGNPMCGSPMQSLGSFAGHQAHLDRLLLRRKLVRALGRLDSEALSLRIRVLESRQGRDELRRSPLELLGRLELCLLGRGRRGARLQSGGLTGTQAHSAALRRHQR